MRALFVNIDKVYDITVHLMYVVQHCQNQGPQSNFEIGGDMAEYWGGGQNTLFQSWWKHFRVGPAKIGLSARRCEYTRGVGGMLSPENFEI